MSMRDRIAETMMSLQELQQQAAAPPAQTRVPLDDYRAPGDLPYREDRPGMQTRIDQMLQGPQRGSEVDPMMEAPPMMYGLDTVDRSAINPDDVQALRYGYTYRGGA
jgi:hypothetical protein